MNDMSQVIIPKSDQWNADDFIAGPQTFTIAEVRISAGSEQPVSIVLVGTPKFYRPCKSMSRVLVQAWGPDASKYVGRSLTLYRDPTVKWAGMEIGGIRISHMSHIDGAKQMMLTATKGSRKPFKVLPLVMDRAASTGADFSVELEELKALARPGNTDALGAKWKEIGADARKALAAELPALKAACAVPVEDVPFDAETGEISEGTSLADQIGLDDQHPAQAKADAIIAELNADECNAILDVAAVLNRHAADIAAMPEAMGASIEIAADKKRQAIRAAQKDD
jgi:hypothetical protein